MTLPALQNTSVLYRRILSQFPQDISLAFAYGSGVFKQNGTSQGQMGKNMLDFVFAVDDPVTWHTMNLMQNRKHYSVLKFLGPRKISRIQDEHGAGVYYNTLVPVDGRIIKYGVISTDSLIDDLLHWKTMYIAGRLHKPVCVNPCKSIWMIQMRIGRMSYGQRMLSCIQRTPYLLPEGQFVQLMALPRTLQQRITRLVDPPGKNRDVEEILLQVAQDPDCGSVVQQGMSSIVKSSSITQTAKGIATTGLLKSLSYSAKKLQKMWKGWRMKTP
uniref:Phosphatidate cytidylyltransferase, mitochondrial n=1 Tax=Hucho hucho TaxID=62062 RepID=A0A4W5QMY5_9TELE